MWQFPILPTEKTRIQAHSTHTTVICLEIHVFFPPTLDCRWFFFSTRGKSDSCVKSYLTRRYTSASDFHNRGASWRGLFKIIVLVLFWRTHRHACGLLLLLAWLSWSDTPPPVPTPSAAAEGYDITIMKRAWLFKYPLTQVTQARITVIFRRRMCFVAFNLVFSDLPTYHLCALVSSALWQIAVIATVLTARLFEMEGVARARPVQLEGTLLIACTEGLNDNVWK